MNPWIATSKRLPHEGDLLQFAIEQRDIVLYGIYSSCMFKSRWSCYSPADVTEWRLLDISPAGDAQRSDTQPGEVECPPASARAA